jgi:serine/threonine-protein kinase
MAMKLLTGELSRNRDVVRRFKREALAASRLTSVNTVQVWDFGHSEGLTYLVMELVEGHDFGKVLKAHGPLPFHRVAKIAVQVCNSLIEAHARGIVHRDLKPENLLLVRSGSSELQDLVKVLDFGLAKLHEDEPRASFNANDVTGAGAIVGTPYYMAPEQIRGEHVDGRTDLYALGAVMYRSITGEPPFSAPNAMGVLTAHLTEELVPPHLRAPQLEIPKEASDIVCATLAKDKVDRPASAAALREILIAYLARAGISGGFLRSGSLEAVAAAGTANAVHAESGPPLAAECVGRVATRSEVVAYARRMRRNGTIAAAIGLVLVGVAVWVVSGWRQRVAPHAAVAHEEIEPNDDVASATPLPLGTPYQGQIGKRIAPEVGDVDFWSVEMPSAEGGALEIDLGALPNLPLCLSVVDAEGAPPIARMCRARGRSLHVDALAVPPGRRLLRVEQDRSTDVPGELAPVYENVSDHYSLRVALAARRAGLEIEPNDAQTAAQIVAVGGAIEARIGWRGDVDVFCAAPGSPPSRFVVRDRRVGAHPSELAVKPLDSLPKETAVGGGPKSIASTCVSITLAKPSSTAGANAIADDDAPYRLTLESR